MRHMQLTAEARQELLEGLSGGAFLCVAAEAAGLPPEAVEQWIKRGEEPRAREPYKTFAREVCQAAARARRAAEMAVLQKSPEKWLRYGPGKEQVGRPGWSTPVRGSGKGAPGSALLMGMLAPVLKALEAYPEARGAAVQALAEVTGGEEDGGVIELVLEEGDEKWPPAVPVPRGQEDPGAGASGPRDDAAVGSASVCVGLPRPADTIPGESGGSTQGPEGDGPVAKSTREDSCEETGAAEEGSRAGGGEGRQNENTAEARPWEEPKEGGEVTAGWEGSWEGAAAGGGPCERGP